MNRWILVLLLALAASAEAQQHKLPQINTETPEGQLLQTIGQEQDPANKLARLEEFAAKYPKHEGAAWVWWQLQTAYTKASQFDKAIEAGDKVLALFPDDLEVAYANLKAAEGKKDAGMVKKYALDTSRIARKLAKGAKPEDEDDDAWKQRLEYAKQVDTYSDYSVYATAAQTTDPSKIVELFEALQQNSPKSEYVPKMFGIYFNALRQSGNAAKAGAAAEKLLEKDPGNEDLLIVAADANMQAKQADKVVTYSAKLIEVMNSKPKPEGVTDADWDKKKTSMLGVAYWMEGLVFGGQGKFTQADKALRAALPLIKGNDQLLPGALFYLGLSNYKMGQGKNKALVAEGLRFSEQAAAYKSPFQGQAAQNVKTIRAEMAKK